MIYSNIKDCLFIPVKMVAIKDKVFPKMVYLKDTHGNMRVYKSLDSLQKSLDIKSYDYVITYNIVNLLNKGDIKIEKNNFTNWIY